MKRTARSTSALLALATLAVAIAVLAQSEDREERFRRMSERAEAEGLAEPFLGIAIDGEITPGVFAIESTGVSTEPVRVATRAFLDSLSEEQRQRTRFEVDDPEWRKWMNQHFYVRAGVGFDEMDERQRQAAFAMMRASLSAKGLKLTRDIMRLNRTLGELNDENFEEYNEWLYWITVMGEPSAEEPWGWQLDGHHVIINYFVLGDQVVMSPLFVGSEPVTATTGRYRRHADPAGRAERRSGLPARPVPGAKAPSGLEHRKGGQQQRRRGLQRQPGPGAKGHCGAELDEASARHCSTSSVSTWAIWTTATRG